MSNSEFNDFLLIPRTKIKCDLNVTHTAKKMYIFKVNIFFAKFRPWCRSIAKIMQNRPCEGHKCCFLWDLDAGLTFFVWPWCRSDKKLQSTSVSKFPLVRSDKKLNCKKFAWNLHLQSWRPHVRSVCKKFAFWWWPHVRSEMHFFCKRPYIGHFLCSMSYIKVTLYFCARN